MLVKRIGESMGHYAKLGYTKTKIEAQNHKHIPL